MKKKKKNKDRNLIPMIRKMLKNADPVLSQAAENYIKVHKSIHYTFNLLFRYALLFSRE